MLLEEGMDNVFARHNRMAEATRRAVQAWGLEVMCLEPKEYSSSLTAVLMPEGHSADAFREAVLDNFNMSLGNGLNKVADKVFRIGHLGDFNELMLMGTLAVFFTLVNWVKVPAYLYLGQFSSENLLTSLVLMPLAPIGVRCGYWLLQRSNEKLIYQLCYVFLLLTGGKLLVEGVMGLLA